jgi:hypothetical protein
MTLKIKIILKCRVEDKRLKAEDRKFSLIMLLFGQPIGETVVNRS